jgi:hypothetical protein
LGGKSTGACTVVGRYQSLKTSAIHAKVSLYSHSSGKINHQSSVYSAHQNYVVIQM